VALLFAVTAGGEYGHFSIFVVEVTLYAKICNTISAVISFNNALKIRSNQPDTMNNNCQSIHSIEA
jgi:hypothetical protein